MIRLRWLIIHCLLLGLPPTAPSWADVDVSEYQTRQSVRSEREREALQAAFERQRRAEAAREQRVQEQESRRLAEEQARREARPYPVKLTEARCTLCHAAQNYEYSAHAWPGWAVVVLRMRLFNLAPLDWTEMWVISRHLSQTYPADTALALLEWGAFATLPTLVAGSLLWYRRRK